MWSNCTRELLLKSSPSFCRRRCESNAMKKLWINVTHSRDSYYHSWSWGHDNMQAILVFLVLSVGSRYRRQTHHSINKHTHKNVFCVWVRDTDAFRHSGNVVCICCVICRVSRGPPSANGTWINGGGLATTTVVTTTTTTTHYGYINCKINVICMQDEPIWLTLIYVKCARANVYERRRMSTTPRFYTNFMNIIAQWYVFCVYTCSTHFGNFFIATFEWSPKVSTRANGLVAWMAGREKLSECVIRANNNIQKNGINQWWCIRSQNRNSGNTGTCH